MAILNIRPLLKRAAVRGASRLGYRVIAAKRMGSFEHARHLSHMFENLGIDTVLDVGANDGGYRRLLREDVGFAGRVISFEPVPDVFQALVDAATNDGRWKGMNVALGNEDGELEMNVCRRSTMSSFLTRDEARLANLGYSHLLSVTDVVKTVRVPIHRLDSIFDDVIGARAGARVFLKCDTQGYDLQVVAGSARSLKSIIALQIELSIKPIYAGAPVYSEVIEHMTDIGFDVTGLFPVRRDELSRIVNFDCVMINSRHPVVADLAARRVVGRTPSVVA
jgi:FkbM family methyltransferase